MRYHLLSVKDRKSPMSEPSFENKRKLDEGAKLEKTSVREKLKKQKI